MAAPRDSLSVYLAEFLANLDPALRPHDLRIMTQCGGFPIEITEDPLGPMVWAWWEEEQGWVYDRRGNSTYLQRTESACSFTATLLFPKGEQDREGFDKSAAAFYKMAEGVRVHSHNTGLWAILPRK